MDFSGLKKVVPQIVYRYKGKSVRNFPCWAGGLDKCSDELTDEHIISESILKYFGNYKIRIKGKKVIASPKTYKAKILCRHHNNALSDYDNEALKLISAWDKMTFNLGGKITHPEADKIIINVDIDRFEKWAAKTLLNMAIFRYLTEQPIMPRLPSLHIHKQLFSNQPFEKPFGIYLLDPQKPIIPNRPAWTIQPCNLNFLIQNGEGKFEDTAFPLFFYSCFGGMEFIGLFNITNLTNEFYIENIANPILESIKGNYEYKEGISIGANTKPNNENDPIQFASIIFTRNGDLTHPVTAKILAEIQSKNSTNPS